MKKYFLLIVLIFGFLLPLVYTNASTGFVPGQIWYSPETLSEGETVKIHTVVWNGDKNNLQAKVEFYDKNVILGTRDVTVLPEQLKEVNITWKVTSGDHTISAKIISSSITSNGKKENIVLKNNKTEEDKIFVPVTIKKVDGESATSSDVIKNELDKAGSKIGDIIPESVSTPISDTFNKIDTFRDNTSTKINESKEKTKEVIKTLDQNINANNEKEAVSATDKPIAYVKLFFLSVIGFIFGNKIVFYGLSIIITFFILRAIYRKIKR
jgi:hypothetical protein